MYKIFEQTSQRKNINANKHITYPQHHWALENMNHNHTEIPLYTHRKAKTKTWTTPTTGEDVGHLELLGMADGVVTWCSHSGRLRNSFLQS